MEVRCSEKQVIDEYTLTDGNRIIVFTHDLKDISEGLKQLVPSLLKVGKATRSFRDQVMESTKEIV